MSRTFLAADLFCGAGGTSTGAARAIKRMGGRLELVAVNHWDKAIATHSRNHPRARHYCVNLDTSNPEEIVPEGYLDLLMASPECVHHSRARGGKPVSDQRRADAWMVNRWLTRLDVAAILIENVPEFLEWGPTDRATGKPIPGKKRLYFEAWWKSLIELGYAVDWRVLNCADYGDATTRKRLFLIARKDGAAIRWPEATHSRSGAADMFGGLQRWRAAREVIDWGQPGQSIFDRKKPLSVKTRLRIARGLQKYGGEFAPDFIDLLNLPAEHREAFGLAPIEGAPQPFVLGQRDSSDAAGAVVPSKARALDEPLFTVTAVSRSTLVDPVAAPFHLANRNHAAAKSADEPIASPTSAHGGGVQLVSPFVLAQGGGGEARPVDQPLPTILQGGALSKCDPVVEPLIDRFYSQSDPQPVGDPLSTVSGSNHHALIEPHLSAYYGNGAASPIDAPVPTITGHDRHALVEPRAEALTVPYGPSAEARSVGEPLHTIPTRDRLAVAEPIAQPFIVEGGHTHSAGPGVRSIDDPISTITGGGHKGVAQPTAEPFLLSRHSNPGPRSTAEPLYTITGSGGGGIVEPDAFLLGRQGHSDPSGRVRDVDEPLATVVTRDTGKPYLAEPEAFLLPRRGHNDPTGRVRDVDDPLNTITGSRSGTPGLVEPFVIPNFGENGEQPPRVHAIDDPVPSPTSRGAGNLIEPTVELPAALVGVDPRRLRRIGGRVYLLDIRYRMLRNRELARAMSFDDDGQYDFVGTQAEVTAQIGNAVPCRTAEALVTAIFVGVAAVGVAS